jgi:hypothetical protein
MSALTTTLARIREHGPCEAGWRKLLKHLGKTAADDEPLPYTVIFDGNGLYDALWCCRVEPQYDRLWRHFAVDCAESVKHLMKDPRSLTALEVARRHADGLATDEELAAAWVAAGAAVRAAAWAAAGSAAGAAAGGGAAGDAAWAAAGAAAWEAAWVAAWDAAGSAAWDAARSAAWDAARSAAWDAFAARFRTLCETGERVP